MECRKTVVIQNQTIFVNSLKVNLKVQCLRTLKVTPSTFSKKLSWHCWLRIIHLLSNFYNLPCWHRWLENLIKSYWRWSFGEDSCLVILCMCTIWSYLIIFDAVDLMNSTVIINVKINSITKSDAPSDIYSGLV